jgi:hypothetical protein
MSVSIEFNIRRQKPDKERDPNLLIYKDFKMEQSMWNVKPSAVTVTRGTTKPISESLRRYLSNIPRKNEIE